MVTSGRVSQVHSSCVRWGADTGVRSLGFPLVGAPGGAGEGRAVQTCEVMFGTTVHVPACSRQTGAGLSSSSVSVACKRPCPSLKSAWLCHQVPKTQHSSVWDSLALRGFLGQLDSCLLERGQLAGTKLLAPGSVFYSWGWRLSGLRPPGVQAGLCPVGTGELRRLLLRARKLIFSRCRTSVFPRRDRAVCSPHCRLCSCSAR